MYKTPVGATSEEGRTWSWLLWSEAEGCERIFRIRGRDDNLSGVAAQLWRPAGSVWNGRRDIWTPGYVLDGRCASAPVGVSSSFWSKVRQAESNSTICGGKRELPTFSAPFFRLIFSPTLCRVLSSLFLSSFPPPHPHPLSSHRRSTHSSLLPSSTSSVLICRHFRVSVRGLISPPAALMIVLRPYHFSATFHILSHLFPSD